MPLFPSGLHRLNETLRGGPGYDAATRTYFAAMTTQPDATRKGLLSTLVQAVEAAGLFAKLDWLNILAAQDPSQSVVNMINPSKLLAQVGTGAGLTKGGTWTTDRGWTGNGTDGYLSYQESLGAGGKFGLNAAILGVWWNGTAASNSFFAGTATSTNNQMAYINGASLQGRLGGSTASNSTGYTNQHHIALRRIDASTIAFHADGVQLGSTIANSVTDASVSSVNGAIGAARGQFASSPIAASYSGALSATDVQALHNALYAYLSAIGAQ